MTSPPPPLTVTGSSGQLGRRIARRLAAAGVPQRLVVRDPAPHAGVTYDLTGPAALTLAEAAATISAVTGRQVRYQPETLEGARASRGSYGAPDWQVDAWVSTYTAIAAGELATVSTAVPELTGHPARTLAEVVGEAHRG